MTARAAKKTSKLVIDELPQPEPQVDRLETVPDKCPNCQRKNGTTKYWGDSTGLGWHYYRFIPGAPAAGCGNCGHVVYLTDQAYNVVRQVAQVNAPKAAAGKITKRMR